jgi:hypothetical protein
VSYNNKVKRRKKSPLKKQQEKLWELCKKYIRARYGNVCYTCGKANLEGANWHTGHFIPSGSCGVYLRYDPRNLRPQCYNCNINNGGSGAEFYREMLKNEGKRYVDQLFKDKQLVVKTSDRVEEMISWYENALLSM